MERQIAITGAGRGIGRAIAERFASDGWEVLALVRDPSSLKLAGKVRAFAFDAADPKSVSACGAQLAKDAPGLFALVNNAGIAVSAPFHKTSGEDYARTMQINVHAPWALTQALMPALLASHGRVVNIASTAALKGFRYTSAYCTSKHALLGMTRALAHEYAPKGVTVNAVCPGYVDTPMTDSGIERMSSLTKRRPDEIRRVLEEQSPQKRLMTSEEVAAFVLFLCGDAARGITGQALNLDGGTVV